MKESLKDQVYNVIILDETGSMESIKHATISGFNELVQSIRSTEQQFPDQKHYITFVTFNSNGIKTHIFNKEVSLLKEINEDMYIPDAMTPLYDAIGITCNELRRALDKENDYHVLATILTDGEENHSKEYTGKAIASLIKELKEKNWTFTFIGSSDINAEKIAIDIDIHVSNVMKFDKNPEALCSMFIREKDARHSYNMKIRNKADTKEDFYKNID